MWISLIHSAAAAASAHKLRLMSPIVEPLIVNPHTTIATPQPNLALQTAQDTDGVMRLAAACASTGTQEQPARFSRQTHAARRAAAATDTAGVCEGMPSARNSGRDRPVRRQLHAQTTAPGFGQCVRGKYCVATRCTPARDCSRPKPNCPTSGLLPQGLRRTRTRRVRQRERQLRLPEGMRGAACETSTMPRPCPSGLVSRDSSHPYSVIMLDASGSSENGIANQSSSSSSSSSSATTNRTRFATCSNRADVTMRQVAACATSGGKAWRVSGPARTPLEWVGLVVTILFVLALIALMTMLFYCSYVRGVKPSDAMRGRWNVRTEEGWKPAEAVGGLPGARTSVMASGCLKRDGNAQGPLARTCKHREASAKYRVLIRFLAHVTYAGKSL